MPFRKIYILLLIVILSPLIFTSFFLIEDITFKNDKFKLSEKKLSEKKWVDSVYSNLSLREKVGQIFMVAGFASEDYRENVSEIEDLISKYKIGGVMFLKGNPTRQAHLTNYYQSLSKIPLMVSIDAEWGLNMRLDSTFKFPWSMTLGAMRDNKLIYKIGKQIGKHCRDIGVNINFAPDVDLNTNYKNPIIGNRAFGEDKNNVYKKGLYFFKGMESEGVMAVIKHFPGHGDTHQDSHKTLPTIEKSKKEIFSNELYPFKKLINRKINGVMVAHLKIPSLDEKYPSSLSKKIITNILIKKYDYENLIFTDALNMKSVSKNYKIGELEELCFLAGNDILLYPKFPKKSIEYLYQKFKANHLDINLLEEKVKKILKYKYRLNLHRLEKINLNNLKKKLITYKDSVLSQECYESAITILKNKKSIIPIKHLKYQKIGVVSLNSDKNNTNTFEEYLKKYTDINYLDYEDDNFVSDLDKITTIILSIHKSDKTPWKNYTLTSQEKDLINFISKRKKTILCVFASPYSIINVPQEKNTDATIIGYQDNYYSQKVMAQMIFGALNIKGKLPVSNDRYRVNNGIKVKNIKRLSYGYPEMENMVSDTLSKVDSIMNSIIKKKYTPGGQILVAKNGRVIYSKNFGKHTYDKDSPKIDNNTLYDLASVTKIASTTLMTMKLVEKGKLNLNKKVEDYIDFLDTNKKKDITIKELLAHNSGLAAWIPFYTRILNNNKKVSEKWTTNNSPIEVSDNIYLKKLVEDSLRMWVYNTKLQKKREHYSDIGFFILGDIIKATLNNENFERKLYRDFYVNLGISKLTFNPTEKFPVKDIAPSEIDKYFRHSEVQGRVHDFMASMQYSTPTNAGLFSNANDLAKLGQMFLQYGEYGGDIFIKKSTFKKFNKRYFKDNLRGLGFDKPNKIKGGPTCQPISQKSFGHTGFTGITMWMDPEEELLYIFLSNRTYPSMRNNKLSKNNIRTRIQKIFYNSINKK